MRKSAPFAWSRLPFPPLVRTATPTCCRWTRPRSPPNGRAEPSTRWSFRRELGTARLLVLDSRAGRIVTGDKREMISEADWAWLEKQIDSDELAALVRVGDAWGQQLEQCLGQRIEQAVVADPLLEGAQVL